MPLTRGDLDCKLPFELVEQILDQCDQKTLLPCALVCHSWMPGCRSHTFQTFEVDGGNERQLSNIASLLETQYSTIPEFIQEIRFNLRESELTTITGNDESFSNVTSSYSLKLILTHLNDRVSSLKKLHLAYDGPRLLSSEMEGPKLEELAHLFLLSFGQITILELHLFAEHDARALIEFKCSFPHLEVLRMHSGCLEARGVDSIQELEASLRTKPPGCHLPASLRTLELGGGDDTVDISGIAIFYRWLSTKAPPPLSNLSIYKIDVEGDWDAIIQPAIEPYLRCCTELRFLHLGFDTGYVTLSATVHYDLSTPQHLESLVVSIRNVVQATHDSVMLGLIRDMLNTLTSPRLRNISFNVSGSGFRVLEEEWNAIDSVLSTTKFGSVHIKLIVPFSDITLDDSTSEEDLPRARQVFPRCDEQGRLSAIRAPFTVKTRTWEDHEKRRDFSDHDEINWVCERFSA
ncbi:hypothetical protein PQX77_017373 [Marasmius sp. AFHP31]|nr:hypothetical protein PQX77_017373 [Marasmius sp. AFHP31]